MDLNSENRAPRILIIGAGSRGDAYARAVSQSTKGVVVAVADPIAFKRKELGRKYIWADEHPRPEQEFTDWRMFISWEKQRRKDASAGHKTAPGVDGVFICVLDEQHAEVISALAPLNLHILSEKPLATTLEDCLSIYCSLLPKQHQAAPQTIFGIGHVLRYSPHNMLLRELLLEDHVIGEIISIEHTEPVGWWHFAHSYVRGNWRKESTSAPSLLTKSCHDIDFLLWLLCSPAPQSEQPPHLPSYLTSTGSLKYLKKSRKPIAAGDATNCLSCPIETDCMFSAKKIYVEARLQQGHTGWPVKIVNPEIEDCYVSLGKAAAVGKLLDTLSEDYNEHAARREIERRPWFGRCVWESDNDVCDDQFVTITWEDDALSGHEVNANNLKGRGAKTATFHMMAYTEKQCERRGRIYGTKGEIEYDSKTISVYDFASGRTKTQHPRQPDGGHGGGDDGLARQFVAAVDAVKNHGVSVEEAQKTYVGCTLEEIIRSHAMVFAAEDARKGRKVVDWQEWWQRRVEAELQRR
ncbi:hypothetical protein LTR16_002543 [Cryomyces antarcticus]|uniref:Gfo/Idh/MocA-like oxidoreductase N-terminal domain-containing protein n=1 Tax=Cryomyces antarcticus TaxID=329879 RepID=A0ABR0M7E0_9PEZI|nr:hypothetical protein LTR16_002543 [Cryomyces antarcticus]